MILRTPLQRSPAPARKARVKAKRSKPRRVAVLRDRGYLDFLKEQKCVVCGHGTDALFTIDPAHGPVNGMRSKGPDNEAAPLCRHHHIEQHRIGWPAFCEKYGIDRARIAAEHYARYLNECKSSGTPAAAGRKED